MANDQAPPTPVAPPAPPVADLGATGNPTVAPPTQTAPQSTIQAAPAPGITDRVWDAIKEGIPAFNNKFEAASHTETGKLATGETPKEQLITPEAAMSDKEKKAHPYLTGAGEVAGEMTSPGNVATVVGAGGFGELPGTAAKVLPRLLSLGFSAGAIKSAYDQYPALKAAMDHGDEAEAKRIVMHMTLDTAMAAYAGQHAVSDNSAAAAAPKMEVIGPEAKQSAGALEPPTIDVVGKDVTPEIKFDEVGGKKVGERRALNSAGRNGGAFGAAVDAGHRAPIVPAEGGEVSGQVNASTTATPTRDATVAAGGTGAASSEELARPEIFVKYSRGGEKTYLGKSPDATMRLGDSILAVNQNTGEVRVQNTEGIADSVALERYGADAKKNFGPKGGAISPAVNAEKPAETPNPQQVVENAGGVFRGNKGGLVEVFLPPDMTKNLPIDDRFKGSVSVTIPEGKLSTQSVRDAMERKFIEMGGKREATMHPVLQALRDKYGAEPVSDNVQYTTSYMGPDGKLSYLPAQTHAGAVESVPGGAAYGGDSEEGRTKIINDSGAIRIRPMNQREGRTFHVIVPKDSVTEQQVDGLRKTMATLGRRGNIMIETAAEPGSPEYRHNTHKPEDWQWQGASDIEPILGKLGVLPNQRVKLNDAYGETGGHVGTTADMKTQWQMDREAERVRELGNTTGPALLETPSHMIESNTRSVLHHELGHAIAAHLVGIPTENVDIWSHLHPETETGAAATTKFDFSKMPGATPLSNGDVYFTDKGLRDAWPSFLQTYLGGGVAQELADGISAMTNKEMNGDLTQLRQMGRMLGFTPAQTHEMILSGLEQTRALLNHPRTIDIIKNEAATREEGLPKTHHFSKQRIQDILKKVTEARNEGNTKGTGAANGAIVPKTEPSAAGANAEGDVREGNGQAIRPSADARKVVKPEEGPKDELQESAKRYAERAYLPEVKHEAVPADAARGEGSNEGGFVKIGGKQVGQAAPPDTFGSSSSEPLSNKDYVFHATDKSRADAIRSNGIRPKSWYANSPQEALRSGVAPISGNRADLRVFAVPRAEIDPVTPDTADMGAREVEKGKYVMSGKSHRPIEVDADGRPLDGGSANKLVGDLKDSGLNADVVGSVATKGKSENDLDLHVDAKDSASIEKAMADQGFEPRGSSVVSPAEAKKSGKKFGSTPDTWARVRRFENADGQKVDVWHDEVTTPIRAYHGTAAPTDFKDFSASGRLTDEEGNPLTSGSGPDPTSYLGAHFAREPQVANKFATRSEPWMRTRVEAGEGKEGAAGPRVMPVDLHLSNPKDFGHEDNLRNFIYEGNLNRAGYAGDEMLNMAMEQDGLDPYEDDEQNDAWMHKYNTDPEFRADQNRFIFERYSPKEGDDDYQHEAASELAMQARGKLEKQGYDGALYKNSVEGGNSVVAFHSHQIESALKAKAPTIASGNEDEFADAVRNTAGANINGPRLTVDVVRYQKPEQAGEPSVRTGVFYSPHGTPYERYYKGNLGYGNRPDMQPYGGTQKIEKQVTLKNPIVAKGGGGGNVPKRAYDALKGKGAYEKMRTDVLHASNYHIRKDPELGVESVARVLKEYGSDPDMAREIIANSTQGNQLAYAIQENIVAHALRDAGHDGIVGYTKIKGAHRLSEIFHVGETHYPEGGTILGLMALVSGAALMNQDADDKK